MKYSEVRGGNKKVGDEIVHVKIWKASDKSQTAMKAVRIGCVTTDDIKRNLGNHFDSKIGFNKNIVVSNL